MRDHRSRRRCLHPAASGRTAASCRPVGPADLAALADNERWPAACFVAALAERETTERGRRRLECHLAEARLPSGKTLDAFDFEGGSRGQAQVTALAACDIWLNNGANFPLFGPRGGAKSQLAAALGFALVENG
jgi:DNA replication protein DnaC